MKVDLKFPTGSLEVSHLSLDDVPVPVTSLEEDPVTDYLGTPAPEGVLGSDHLGDYTLSSEPLVVRTLRLGTLDVEPGMGRFGTPVPTHLCTPGLGLSKHRLSILYPSFLY